MHAYSKMGRTKVLYALSFSETAGIFRFLLRNPRDLAQMELMCRSKVRSEVGVIPRYLDYVKRFDKVHDDDVCLVTFLYPCK